MEYGPLDQNLYFRIWIFKFLEQLKVMVSSCIPDSQMEFFKTSSDLIK